VNAQRLLTPTEIFTRGVVAVSGRRLGLGKFVASRDFYADPPTPKDNLPGPAKRCPAVEKAA
jgi:hypothetical protein